LLIQQFSIDSVDKEFVDFKGKLKTEDNRDFIIITAESDGVVNSEKYKVNLD